MTNRIQVSVVVTMSLVVFVGLIGGTAVGQQSESYVVEQGERCTEIAPLSVENQTVSEFYGHTLNGSDETLPYSANTPIDIEESNDATSTFFLYDGPEGLSLVVIHGATNATSGGAASLDFQGLDGNGTWVVKDDPRNESLERWNETSVDWSWRDAYTDGGALRGAFDGQFEIAIDPAFNGQAALEPLTPGNVTEWRALSAEDTSLTPVELDMNQSVTVSSGSCE